VSAAVVDSSAWLDYLGGDKEAVKRLDPILAKKRVLITGPIYAELLSGARSTSEYALLKELLEGVEWAAEPGGLWFRVAEHRFALARRGFEASLIDLSIALSAFDGGYRLVSRDRDFARIRTVVPIELDLF
jgi:predicted nucleic acid-binding protein